MYICKNLYLFVGISGINRTISYSFLRISYKNRLPSCILIRRLLDRPNSYTNRHYSPWYHTVVKSYNIEKCTACRIISRQVIFNFLFSGNYSINRDSATGALAADLLEFEVAVDLSPIWTYILIAVLLGRDEVINVHAYFSSQENTEIK